ncbi:MAG TPA: DUF1800 domain-containing protein [Hyphomonadaceae bacterium]|nr:DUF1800 domain-containing protein [Hyphomonadaceae bacterium]
MRHLLAALMVLALAACGGGGGSSSSGGSGSGGSGSGPPPPKPTAAEAARLLTQASFGPTEASIADVQSQGISAWINAQEAMALPATSHQAYVESVMAANSGSADANAFYASWWRQAATEPGQLRQRVAFALSQIFVISLADPNIDVRGAASYYDMLERDAFGNFRQLLQDVTYHPQMGLYLTFLANQKEDAAGTRTPDENYAREVMQLMTIGLQQLNADGSVKLDGSGNPIPTYSSADIQGLAKVFTGLSWYNAAPTNSTFFGGSADANRAVTPMIAYPNFHSTSAKSFLGTTIAASATINVAGDITTALDTLYNHPNVGPFIAQRLIQQLITSNPSPAYVGRVAAVFANNGSGVRGDMGAVVSAVLTDSEARDISVASSTSFGKLREPVVRLANWARAFGATSQTGNWLITSTSANTSLNQAPLTSPSVFNFWRPGFTPPGTTQLGSRNLLSPEFQVVDEVTVASYINVMQDWINQGVGSTPPGGTGRDVRSAYTSEIALTDDPTALVNRMNNLLFYGQMSATLQGRINTAISAVAIPASNGTNQAAIDTARLNRAKTAVFFSMISPEYLVQR